MPRNNISISRIMYSKMPTKRKISIFFGLWIIPNVSTYIKVNDCVLLIIITRLVSKDFCRNYTIVSPLSVIQFTLVFQYWLIIILLVSMLLFGNPVDEMGKLIKGSGMPPFVYAPFDNKCLGFKWA